MAPGHLPRQEKRRCLAVGSAFDEQEVGGMDGKGRRAQAEDSRETHGDFSRRRRAEWRQEQEEDA